MSVAKKLPVDIRRARKILTSADGMSIDTIFSSRRRPYSHVQEEKKKIGKSQRLNKKSWLATLRPIPLGVSKRTDYYVRERSKW